MPGPVTVLNTKRFKFTLDTPTPAPTAASAATVLMEIFVAPAMVMRLRKRNEVQRREDDLRNEGQRDDDREMRTGGEGRVTE